MKLATPINENYAATIISIKSINILENCDNIVGTPLLGYQAIVSKNTKVGDLGVLFVAETQLSDEFCHNNNLYRHTEKNKIQSSAGFIEDSRRVKAIRLRNNRSDALFMPLSSLSWTGAKIDDLREGDVFDELNGKEVCKKFVRKQKSVQKIHENKIKRFVRVDEKFLPEHYSSSNYWRNLSAIKPLQRIIVTQKLHGTSVRIGNTLVKRKLILSDKILKKLGVKIQETEFDHVYGSRRSIKDINNPYQKDFYDSNIYIDQGKLIDNVVPENFIIYGELIGWTPSGSPIQKNYTYDVPKGETRLYVYRVALVTNQGRLIDLSWDQVKEFCNDSGLKYVPEFYVGAHNKFKVDKYIDIKFKESGIKNAIGLSEDSPVDEGVCVRVDGLAPYILKAKSPLFFEHETKMLDEEATDMEEEQS